MYKICDGSEGKALALTIAVTPCAEQERSTVSVTRGLEMAITADPDTRN